MKAPRVVISIALALGLGITGALPAGSVPGGTKVRRYARGLNFPIDMAWAPGTKKIFFTEKSGAVRVMVRGRVKGTPCVRLNVNSDGERGALGLVLHPNFKKKKQLWVYYTNASPLENRVTRFDVRRDRCINPKHILTGLQTLGATNHNAGHLEFVKGNLFIATGDAADPSRAQDTSSLLGKILRVKRNGGVPDGNPFENRVWSYGHRNPFGLAHEPGTARIFSTENGPHCDDELNRIKKGRNYGWGPGYVCGTAGVGEEPKGPLKRWSSVIVPTDPTWYKGRLRSLSGALYMGDFSSGRLHKFKLNKNRSRIRKHKIIHRAPSGILDVQKGPGGWLYFMTAGEMYRIRAD